MSAALTIRPAGAADWAPFRGWHYCRGPLAPLACAWTAHLPRIDRPVAFVGYAYAPLACAGRRAALARALWGGQLAQRAGNLNANLRVLHRLCVAPGFRGSGTGTALVRRTLPLTGVPWVECISRRVGCLELAGFTPCGPLPLTRAATRLRAVVRMLGMSTSQIARLLRLALRGDDSALARISVLSAEPGFAPRLLAVVREHGETHHTRLRGVLREGELPPDALSLVARAVACAFRRRQYSLWTHPAVTSLQPQGIAAA